MSASVATSSSMCSRTLQQTIVSIYFRSSSARAAGLKRKPVRRHARPIGLSRKTPFKCSTAIGSRSDAITSSAP